MIKVAREESGIARLTHESNRLQAIHANPALSRLHPLVPDVLSEGERGGRHFLAETAMPGSSAAVAFKAGPPPELIAEALAHITLLHQSTASQQSVTDLDRLGQLELDQTAALLVGLQSDPEQILAVEALQTLINNWRGPAGRMRYSSLFPSSNVVYFNGF
ncbi:MAG: hypothetical protein GY953_00715, partial [bacterium]|nr:hypothetical protein [bacterium]